MERTSIQVLEGDGILEDFYQLLWIRDPMFGTIPSILAPDTVLYKFDQPCVWYFTFENGLKKKMKNKLLNEEVERVFLKNVPECGIVATFFYTVERDKEKKIIFEYYDVAEFKKWISSKKPNNGILQRFIQPKGDRNFVIRATWSPKICFLEKIENLCKFTNTKYDIYERTVTIDGKAHNSQTVPLRGYVLPSQVERICKNICQHVKNISIDEISIHRLVLNFKIDPQGRIWFLFASSLRLDLEHHVNYLLLWPKFTLVKLSNSKYYSLPKAQNIINHSGPDFVNLNRLSNPTKPYNLRKKDTCASCNKKLDEAGVISLRYEHIVKGFDYDHLKSNEAEFARSRPQAKQDDGRPTIEEIIKNELKYDRLRPMAMNVEAYEIPGLIRKLHPHLTVREYNQLKNEPGFWKHEVIVCESCYLNICKSIIESGSVDGVKDPKSKIQFFGTGPLRPESITLNRNLTLSRMKRREKETELQASEIHPTQPPSFMKRMGYVRSVSSGAIRSRYLRVEAASSNNVASQTHLEQPSESEKASNAADFNESDDSSSENTSSLNARVIEKTPKCSRGDLSAVKSEESKAFHRKLSHSPSQRSNSQRATFYATNYTNSTPKRSSNSLLSPINLATTRRLRGLRIQQKEPTIATESTTIISPQNQMTEPESERKPVPPAMKEIPKRNFLKLLAKKTLDAQLKSDHIEHVLDSIDREITVPSSNDTRFRSSNYSTKLYKQSPHDYFQL